MQPTSADILRDVRATIREPYAWPGGYPRYVVLTDGAMLCCDCARAQYRQISWATRANDRNGWGSIGVSIYYENDGSLCAHCGAVLESAYGDVEE